MTKFIVADFVINDFAIINFATSDLAINDFAVDDFAADVCTIETVRLPKIGVRGRRRRGNPFKAVSKFWSPISSSNEFPVNMK